MKRRNSRWYSVWCKNAERWSQLSEMHTEMYSSFTISISNTHSNLLAPWLVYATMSQYYIEQRRENTKKNTKQTARHHWQMRKRKHVLHSHQCFTAQSIQLTRSKCVELQLCFTFIHLDRAHFSLFLSKYIRCIWIFRKQNGRQWHRQIKSLVHVIICLFCLE